MKRKSVVADRLKELNIDPVEGMVRIAKAAESAGNLPLAGRMYGELLEYTAPKLKQVEHTLDEESLEKLDAIQRRHRIAELQARLGYERATGQVIEGTATRIPRESVPAVPGSATPPSR